MVYTFKDIGNAEIYNDTRVAIITGGHAIFNNMVSDDIMNTCRGEISTNINGAEMVSYTDEFLSIGDTDIGGKGLSDADKNSHLMKVDFSTFRDIAYTPSFNGKWYCRIEQSELDKKKEEWVQLYIKKPSEYAKLVINCSEWKQYKDYLRNKILAGSKFSHLFKLSYPTNNTLIILVNELFMKHGLNIKTDAVKYFIMRMSDKYEDYVDTVELITSDFHSNYGGNTIDMEKMKYLMHDIQNFVIDDFIEALVKPMKSPKIQKTRKLYRMIECLSGDYDDGYSGLVRRLKYKINTMLSFRIAINSGVIPVLRRYGVSVVKDKLGKEHPLYKVSDFSFKKSAYISSLTTLKDWYYMRLILSNIGDMYDESQCQKAILALIHRSVIPNDRLLNDIGVKDTLTENLVKLNMTPYDRNFIGFEDSRYIDYMT